MTALLAGFWVLFQMGLAWAPIAFYFVGQIMGLLLISHFWTLANDIYDPRQAKRLFGFIGGGASLGGMAGSALLTLFVTRVGSETILLTSAASLFVCVFVVSAILRVSQVDLTRSADAAAKRGAEGVGALQLLRQSKHLRVITVVTGFAAIGAGLLDQQLNMAVEGVPGRRWGRCDRALPRPGAALALDCRLCHPGLAGESHPPAPRDWFRPLDSPGQHRRDRGYSSS